MGAVRNGRSPPPSTKFDAQPILTILPPMQRHLILTLLAIWLLLAACVQQPQDNNPIPTAPVVQGTPTSIATPAVQTQPDSPTPTAVLTNTTRSLIIWLPPEIAARTPAGSDTFLNQLSAVTADFPDLEIRVEQKAISGQGGMLSYLRTGRSVVPDILPDLIVLPTNQLSAALTDNLIYPMDGLLNAALLEDLYPAARNMAQIDEQILGYPFALTDLGHLAYTTSAFTTTVPITWPDLLGLSAQSFLFPGAGRPGTTLALQMYLDAGGQLVNDVGQPSLQAEPLTQVLEQFNQGRSSGFIIAQSNSLATIAEAWQLYNSGTATLVQTTADQLLLSQTGEQSTTSGFAPLPGLTDHLTPLVNGWAWAISTPDPAQQALAIEVMTGLLNDTRLTEWSLQSGILPARQSAFALWPQDDPYTLFLGQEMAVARPFPATANTTIMGVLGNALLDVLTQSKTPQAAAEEAAATIMNN
ncbi:MAG: extracellular solute-binding protein [Ardenticatenaceae bacterium]|nr:extracellular solute-binding protein [Anaerolineales bacterium]MCB8920222.1 extracellular solute-binding protein [Ardenticatenaceae bacterium]MCB9004894.1 extracellular solute-binding protein [Ardenticatenaceae bacterium]